MIYLVAIFLPPIYFFTKNRIFAGIFTSLLFVASIIFYIMVVLAPVGIAFWFLSAIVAVWDLRKRLMREQAKMIAQEMAAAGGPGTPSSKK